MKNQLLHHQHNQLNYFPPTLVFDHIDQLSNQTKNHPKLHRKRKRIELLMAMQHYHRPIQAKRKNNDETINILGFRNNEF